MSDAERIEELEREVETLKQENSDYLAFLTRLRKVIIAIFIRPKTHIEDYTVWHWGTAIPSKFEFIKYCNPSGDTCRIPHSIDRPAIQEGEDDKGEWNLFGQRLSAEEVKFLTDVQILGPDAERHAPGERGTRSWRE